MATELHLLYKKFTFFSVGHQPVFFEFIEHTPDISIMLVQGGVLRPLPVGADDDVVDIGVGDVGHLLQAVLDDPLKNGYAIFQAHHDHTPLHGPFRGAAACVGP